MNDPVRGCDVYKNIGCTHVDGYLCDYPSCSILKDYRMNSRIRELWDEAAKLETDTSWEGQTKFMEKFAELIIKECCVALRPMLRDMISRSKGVDLIVKHFRGEE